jgi:hypothetical protein
VKAWQSFEIDVQDESRSIPAVWAPAPNNMQNFEVLIIDQREQLEVWNAAHRGWWNGRVCRRMAIKLLLNGT